MEDVKNNTLVYAKHNGARTSVKRAAPIMALIRDKNITEAQRILKFSDKKAAALTLKVLNSAIANARHNLDLSEANLYVSEAYATPGTTMKRGRIVARSRFSPILKRTAHLVIGLSERKQG